MNIQSVYDFYYLEALKAKPPAFGSKPQEKLYNDVCKTYDKLVPTLARALYHYLFLACFGEARHARSQADAWYNDMPIGGDRDEAYGEALNYEPEGTLKALDKTFNSYSWNGSGYGGGSWGKIVTGAMYYGEWKDSLFIDHVVDLEHHGGNCFDKDEVRYTIDLRVCAPYMSNFLSYKAEHDILSYFEGYYDDYAHNWAITKKTMSLLERYYNTRNIDIPKQLEQLNIVTSAKQWTYKEPNFGTKIPEDLRIKEEEIYDDDEYTEEQHPINRIYERYLSAINHLPVYPLKRERSVG